ncbi:MAG: FAD-dependent oxidoreductase [Armatimonadetes bacterium]|nr:FAD-dependent oxidoreductase [Armatimonadota bacterium]
MYGTRYGLDTLVFAGGLPGGQAALAARIENYPGFPEGISGMELTQAVRSQAEKMGAEFVTAQVMGLSRSEDGTWILFTDIGEAQALAVIVATGGQPRQLGIPGEKEFSSAGVSYCATCDGFLYRGKTVAVVGGGNTAIEDALHLSEICEKVYVVHRRDALRADKYLQERAFARDNIEFVWDSVPVEIVGREAVERLRVRNKKTNEDTDLAVEAVFVAIGYEAQTDWLGNYVDREGSFIIADEDMKTKSPGLFAAGDVRVKRVRQITTAVGDATVAAFFAYDYIASLAEAK